MRGDISFLLAFSSHFHAFPYLNYSVGGSRLKERHSRKKMEIRIERLLSRFTSRHAEDFISLRLGRFLSIMKRFKWGMLWEGEENLNLITNDTSEF